MSLKQSRAQGSFIGLAIADAMGAPVEFAPPGSFPPVTGYRGGGPFNLQPGQYTDDASMALALADSLLACGGVDLRDQMERFWRWYREGENSSTGSCFDIGLGTRSALEHFRRTGNPEAGGPDSLGNGALMRMAPLPIFFHQDCTQAVAQAESSTRTTHGHPQALRISGYFAELLWRALNGATKTELLDSWYAGEDEELRRVAHGSWRTARVRARGHALYALEAALWAFGSTDSFEACVLAAVNLGDDADTVGAIAGQLAGAVYGLEGIPEDWIRGLQDSDRFLSLALQLLNA